MADVIKIVLTSGNFWAAFLVLVQTLLFILWPNFNRELWLAIQGVILSILSVLGVSVITKKVDAVRAIREAQRVTKAE